MTDTISPTTNDKAQGDVISQMGVTRRRLPAKAASNGVAERVDPCNGWAEREVERLGKARQAHAEYLAEVERSRSKAERRRANAADGTEVARRQLTNGGEMKVLWHLEPEQRNRLDHYRGAYDAMLRQSWVPPGPKLVWIYLASMRPKRDALGKDGWVRPYQKSIAKAVGLPLRTVKRYLAGLEKVGALEVRQRGKRNSNLYRVMIPLWPSDFQKDEWCKGE